MRDRLQTHGLAVITAAVAAAAAAAQAAPLSFTVEAGGWPNAAHRDAAVNSLQAVVNRHNAYGDFGGYNIYAYYNAGIPTAQASYLGSIGYGGTYPNERVTLHEANHYLGSGTHSFWYDGPRAVAILEQFDGVGARFGSGGSHFWPYGHNYDNEWSEINAQRNIAIMYALRGDWGIGSVANPAAWAATNVTLTGNDAAGESGFNFGSKWSDNTFAHPNAAYSTGAFSIRTPQGYPSWKFAGNSLTVSPGGRLLFNGWGTSGVVTINNLTVNNGTVRHDQFSQDLFQLAGSNVTLAGTATFEAANGDIKVLAAMGGSGALAKTGSNALVLAGNNTYTGVTTVSAGKLVLDNVNLASTSGVTVNSGGTFNARGNVTTGGTLTATSGTIDLVDGVRNTLTPAVGLTLNNAALTFEIATADADRIATVGLANVSGTNTVNVAVLPGQNITGGSNYTLVTASGGLSAANFAMGAKPASLGFYQFNLATPTPTALQMSVTGNPAPAMAYWTGQASTLSADANNNWGTGPSINKSNWSTNAAGTADPLQLPGPNTSVIFNAANATGVGGVLTTRLDSNYTIGGLTVDVPSGGGITSSVINTNGNALTLGSGGVTLAATSTSSATMSGTGSVILSGNQSWANNNSTRGLSVSSGIRALAGATTLTLNGTGAGGVTISGPLADATGGGGGALSVAFNQAGTTTLTAANTLSGSVTVNGGTVFVNPGNAATNRGFSYVSSITINSGGTLRSGANGLFGWDGTQEHPITVNAGGTLAALGTATTDVGVGFVTLNGGTMAALGTTATDYGSFRFDQATDKLLVTENSVVSARNVKFGNASAAIEVAAGKTLSFTGTVTDATAGGTSYLNKTGAGTLAMSGANAFSGAATISAGTLNLTGSIATSNNVSAGNGAGANATLAIGSTAVVTGYEVWFGQAGSPSNAATGVGTVAAGGTINSQAWTVVGRSGNSSSSGTLTLNGGTLNIRTGGTSGNLEVAVFDAVSGTLDVNANSNVRLQTNANILLGAQNTTGNGTVNHNGGNITFYSNAGTTVGGTGVLTLGAGSSAGTYTYNLNGGVLTVPQINKTSTNANAKGNFNFNGGTLKAAAASTTFMQGLTAATVKAGPAVIDTNNFNVTIAQRLQHDTLLGGTPDGGLTKLGAGTLTLASSNNTYSGGTRINDGVVLPSTATSIGGAAIDIGGTAGAAATGRLALATGITLANPITFRGRTNASAGLQNIGNTNSLAGSISLESGGSIYYVDSDAGTLNLNGAISSAATGSRVVMFRGAGNGTVNGAIQDGNGSVGLAKEGAGTWTLNNASNTYTGPTTVNAGTLRLNATVGCTSSVTVTGGTVELSTGGGSNRVLKTTGTLSITTTGKIDLKDNKLITTTPAGTAAGGTYNGVQGFVQSASNGGAWNGATGLTTTLPDAQSGLTSIGVATAEQLGRDTFAGQSVTPASTVAMYTYAGDANLDGTITGDDYSAIDFSILIPGTDGWYNGDFNYDGAITGDDYSAIDFNILAQGAPFPTSGSLATALGGVTAVPEPAAGAVVALAASAFRLTRRRRRAANR